MGLRLRIILPMLLLVLATTCLAQVPVESDELTFTIRNTYGEPLHFWAWPQVRRQWNRPPIFLPRNGETAVRISDDGRHYIVLVDLAKRERRLGWYDLRDLMSKLPDKEFVIGSKTETEVRQVAVCRPVEREEAYTYTVTVYTPEQRTRTRSRFNPRTGRYEQVEENYTVLVPHQEERTGTRSVCDMVEEQVERVFEVQVPVINVRNGDNLQPLDEYLKSRSSPMAP